MKTLSIIALSSCVLAFGCAEIDDESELLAEHHGSGESAPLYDTVTGNVIPFSKARLKRSPVEYSIFTNLGWAHAGEAVTVWLCGFNTPEGCLDPDACGSADENGFLADYYDPTYIASAGTFCKWGAGAIVGPWGNFYAAGVDDPNAENLYGTSVDAANAEFQFWLRTHGPASSDPAVLDAQLNTWGGGCDPDNNFLPCTDLQVTNFAP